MTLVRAAIAFYVFLIVAKAAVAGSTDLFGDEAFYFLCSQRLDIAYADHPFMTALLIRGGVDLFGPSTFGVRFFFLIIGAVFPFAVYALARTVVDRTDARLAAGLSLVIPATAHLGVIAIPDVPLLLYATLALHGFLRAAATREIRYWVTAAVFTALGLSTHLRFVLVPFSFAVYLLITRDGRQLLRTVGVWVYAVIASLGFLPVLLYNLRLDWAPLRFQGADRHEGGFDLEALIRHIPFQMGAVTPVAYCVLIAVLISLIRRAKAERGPAICACFALAHLGLFLVTSPIADSEHATVHWPAVGYIPLLVFAPAWLRAYVARRPHSKARRWITILTPGIGAVALTAALVEMTLHPLGIQSLQRPFSGWSEVADAVDRRLPTVAAGANGVPIVIADNYLLAGNLAQKLYGKIDLYVLNHPKNIEHGRASQFPLWGNGEEGIRGRAGEEALLVLEPKRVSSADRDEWKQHGVSFFVEVEDEGRVEVDDGRGRIFVFRRGEVRSLREQ